MEKLAAPPEPEHSPRQTILPAALQTRGHPLEVASPLGVYHMPAEVRCDIQDEACRKLSHHISPVH